MGRLKKEPNYEAMSYSGGWKRGGKVIVITPDNEVKKGYDAWKDQILVKQKKLSDYIDAIKKAGYPKEIEEQLINSLGKKSNDNEDLLSYVKQLDIKKKKDEKEKKGRHKGMYRTKGDKYGHGMHKGMYRTRGDKYGHGIHKRIGGSSGENFREDFKNYIANMDLGNIDPDDKIQIRKRLKEVIDEVPIHIEPEEEHEEQEEEHEEEPKEEPKEEHEEQEEEHEEEIDEEPDDWQEFKKANPLSKHKEEFEKIKKKIPGIKYQTYVSYLFRKHKHKLLKDDKKYEGLGESEKHKITGIINEPLCIGLPKNIDGKPMGWTSRPLAMKGGKKRPIIMTHKGGKKQNIRDELNMMPTGSRIVRDELNMWNDAHPELEPLTIKGNLSNVNRVVGGSKIGGKTKKGKIPTQLKAWHEFMHKHPWDGKEDRKCYMKRLGQLYKK